MARYETELKVADKFHPEGGLEATLTQRQLDAIARIVRGDSIGQICDKMNIPRSTLHRWRTQNPRFRAYLNAIKNDALAATRTRMVGLADEAAGALSGALYADNGTLAFKVLKEMGMMKPQELEPEEAGGASRQQRAYRARCRQGTGEEPTIDAAAEDPALDAEDEAPAPSFPGGARTVTGVAFITARPPELIEPAQSAAAATLPGGREPDEAADREDSSGRLSGSVAESVSGSVSTQGAQPQETPGDAEDDPAGGGADSADGAGDANVAAAEADGNGADAPTPVMSALKGPVGRLKWAEEQLAKLRSLPQCLQDPGYGERVHRLRQMIEEDRRQIAALSGLRMDQVVTPVVTLASGLDGGQLEPGSGDQGVSRDPFVTGEDDL